MPELMIGCSKSKGKLSKKMLLNKKREKRGSGLALFGLQPTGTGAYILLNEIQTMFSQLAKRSAKVLRTDLCSFCNQSFKRVFQIKQFLQNLWLHEQSEIDQNSRNSKNMMTTLFTKIRFIMRKVVLESCFK